MSFADTQAPPITRENAAEYARRAVKAREANRAAKLLAAQAHKPEPRSEVTRRNVTLRQLDELDHMIDESLKRRQADLFLKLSAAKERLWKLVAPTAGVLRPKRSLEAARRPSVEPVLANSAPQASEPPSIQPAG